jgi:hypothetical protein
MALPPGTLGKADLPTGAQDPAHKAAQDALQQALAEQGGAPAAEKPIRWQVPQLPDFFDMATAVGEAMDEATRFMNHRMQGEGVVVALQQPRHESMTDWQALVVEDGSTRVLQRYEGTDLLKLYAAHHAGRGVVVDGEV